MARAVRQSKTYVMVQDSPLIRLSVSSMAVTIERNYLVATTRYSWIGDVRG